MAVTLYDLLPRAANLSSDNLLGQFLKYTEARRLTLYPAQEEAILELFEEKNVILNTPTGSGKSLVATALHFAAIAQGRRSMSECTARDLGGLLEFCRHHPDFQPLVLCSRERRDAAIPGVRFLYWGDFLLRKSLSE